MGKTHYRISNRAIIDLEEIWNYTYDTWPLEQADRYYQLLLDEFEFLAKYPRSGKTVDEIHLGYRVSVVRSHLVFYRIENEFIEIIRILNQKMNIKNRIKE